MVKMKKKEKLEFIVKTLQELYPEIPIPLNHHDPYTLLVAVLLSAQCTDERVNQVTPHLFDLADNPTDMFRLEIDQIQAIIRPCGLAPAKSKAIHTLSGMIIHQFEGKVPADFEALESLPGVGHKTASVVMSQAFGVPAFPVDTHIHRLAYRWGLSSGKNVETTEKDLKAAFDISLWNELHLQIIYFGRQYCPARGHNPYECPICRKVGRTAIFKDYDSSQSVLLKKKLKKGKQKK